MLLAMVDDIRVILVKLADRLHNMRTLHHLPEERRVKIAQETRDIYAPIANRLGMSKVKNELEELSFKYLEPQAYEALRQRVEARRRATEGMIEELRKTITAKLEEAQVPVIHIDGRIKRLFSIHQKLKRQKIDLEQVYDPVPGRIKDFIAMPRPNGYQSLHTSVVSERGFPFEVQIRSAEMHRIAEEGIAAHWKYKEGRIGADRDEQYFLWLRQLLEWQQEVRDPQEFLQNLKIDLYPEEVYIFTPKGEVKALPRDATPVDFAYAIHTDVGHQCVGARVNGKMVPLRTRLRNGDIVEIVTTPGHKPSRDWLNFATTSRARNKIKHFIHAEEKVRSLELGKKLFDKEARRFGLNVTKLTESQRFAEVLTESGFQKPDELFTAIAYGKLAVKAVLTKLVPQEQLKEPPQESALTSVVRRVLGTGEEKIKVRGIDDIMVFRARCCNPIRGEKIVGYITRGKGVSVHSAVCPNVLNLLYDPERRIDVEWDKGTDVSPYTVRLSIQVEDRRGILADVSSKIAGINTNIRNVEATTTDQMGRIDMTVEISDLKHLQKVIKSLRSVEGVVDVERATN
jgi:guanosine-3',5'-bis(diphosphate) 3'-pyrophosphohydrolase